MSNNVLEVQMFGNFAMRYNGEIILNEGRTSESQFIYLMQIVLHNSEKGISRDQVEEILFGDRELEDVHHATRSVIYNAKKKLKASPLPDANYMMLKKGILHWTPEIEVREDAKEMERLTDLARVEEDPVKKKELFLKACYLYKGEFLGNQIGMLWIAQEGRRYRTLFAYCVEQAVTLLREQDDYTEMENLGRYAAGLQPLSDWETITMEALVATGRFMDAAAFYDDTLDLYFRTEGIRPSQKMMKLFNQLGSQVEHQYALLDDIQSQIENESQPLDGGFLCSYMVFQGVYQMVRRMMERGGQSVFLMLCTVVDSKGNVMKAIKASIANIRQLMAENGGKPAEEWGVSLKEEDLSAFSAEEMSIFNNKLGTSFTSGYDCNFVYYTDGDDNHSFLGNDCALVEKDGRWYISYSTALSSELITFLDIY